MAQGYLNAGRTLYTLFPEIFNINMKNKYSFNIQINKFGSNHFLYMRMECFTTHYFNKFCLDLTYKQKFIKYMKNYMIKELKINIANIIIL